MPAQQNDNMRTTMKVLATIALAIASIIGAHAATIDQQQTIYNAGMSGRAMYSYYQSFTAGTTGTLTAVDIGFFNSISGTAQIEIWRGAVPTSSGGGVLLSSVPVSVTSAGTGAINWNQFTVSVPISAGTKYSLVIIPTGLRDPFGLCAGYPAPYSGGQFGWIQGGVAYPWGAFSMTFRTWVGP